MPWFMTKYQTSGRHLDRQMRGYIYANNQEEAALKASLRNLGEEIVEDVGDGTPYVPPSEQLFNLQYYNYEQVINLIHGTLWLAFLWSQYDKSVSTKDLVGDDGIVHDVVHCITLFYPKERVITMLQQIEKEVPGYLSDDS
jgi:hypothetical protein